MIDCTRYDFAVFSLERLMCTLKNGSKHFIIIMVILATLQMLFPGRSNHFYTGFITLNGLLDWIFISLGIFIILKVYKYLDINCDNNPNCRAKSWGHSYWKEYFFEGEWSESNEKYFKVKWFEYRNTTKEKNDN
jgi:hypothetical protein